MRRFKVGLVGLFGLLTLFGFCSSENICSVNDYITGNIIFSGTVVVPLASYANVFDYGNYGAGTYCIYFYDVRSSTTYQFGFASSSTGTPSNLYKLWSDQEGNWICLYGNKRYLNINAYQGYNGNVSYKVFKLPTFLENSVPCQSHLDDLQDLYDGCMSELSGYDSDYRECVSDYNTCVSDRNQLAGMVEDLSSELYACQNSSSGGSCSTGSVSWSALYINNIQHLSSPIIRVDIPEEINWDYSVENNTFNLDVEGYNVDSDYIEGIINLQKSTPNNQDFNDIITKVIPLLVPGFVIILFIIFIFRFIKKIF